MPTLSAQTDALQCVAMPRFSPITANDLPKIKMLLASAPSRSCDYTVGGIYLWIDWFKYEFAIVDETLFIKGRAENNPDITAFSLPIGAMSLEQSLEVLRRYCDEESLPLVLSAIPEDSMERFSAIDNVGIEALDAWSDYIYLSSDLATLAGKKLQKKRNHYNRFIADNPNYSFGAITDSDLEELRRFYYDLRCNGDDQTPMAQYEASVVAQLLDESNPCGFEGALLRDDSGKIVAFTFGEVVGDTLHVHIEKMRHDVNGAGAAITKMYAAMMGKAYPQITYINRQDDAGDPGLRHAKMTYCPAYILKKYNVYIR